MDDDQSDIVASAAKTPFLEARSVSKNFGGVRALRGVDAAFCVGEVTAVMGENGAGKSTLMKVLAGIHAPTSGEVLVDGQTVRIPDVRKASELGIAFIHQELNLAENLSAAANIFLGREPTRGGLARFIGRREIRRRSAEILSELQANFRPSTKVADLGMGHRQVVEIAKALSQDAKLIIMDEPTSSLTQHETDALLKLVGRLREDGKGIVFISHRLGEVSALADRVVVLRDGELSGNLEKGEISREAMVSLMVGRELEEFDHTGHSTTEPVLKVAELRVASSPRERLSFELRHGEVLGVAGLVGAGRSEMARALFGIDRKLGGRVSLDGKVLKIRQPEDAIDAGIGFVPEDRKGQGLVVEFPIGDNVVMAGLRRYQVTLAHFLDFGRMRRVADSAIRDYAIKARSRKQPVASLSGGNQQKVVLAKWVTLDPKVLMLDEPTRGVDVGAKAEIYRIVERLVERGVGVLFISSDLEEILRVSDRVLVMREGRIAGELDRSQLDEETVMRLATGTGVDVDGDQDQLTDS